MPECICEIELATGAESWVCPVHLRRYPHQDEIKAEMDEAMKGEMAPGMRFPGDLMGWWAHNEKLEPKYTLPEEVSLLKGMFDFYQRLKALGWQEAMSCPKDGSKFLAIEAGSTGTFVCRYEGVWPNGHWWISSCGDAWAGRPILWKPLPPEPQKEEPK